MSKAASLTSQTQKALRSREGREEPHALQRPWSILKLRVTHQDAADGSTSDAHATLPRRNAVWRGSMCISAPSNFTVHKAATHYSGFFRPQNNKNKNKNTDLLRLNGIGGETERGGGAISCGGSWCAGFRGDGEHLTCKMSVV